MENLKPPRILIIEDEADIRSVLSFYLESQNFEVESAEDGLDGFNQFMLSPPDILILDLMLPKMNGTEICSRLKRDDRFKDKPIIMLTAKNSEADRILGFEIGADDYVTKPFSLQELTLRIKSLLQKTMRASQPGHDLNSPTPEVLKFGDLTINPLSYEVWWAKNKLHLTNLEFKLLHFLASRPERVLERGTLLKYVWGYGQENNTRTVDTHMVRLRIKLDEAGKFIETVRGVGYKFNPQA